MKKRYIIVAICLVLFVITTILVCLNKVQGFDDAVYDLVYKNHNDILDFFFIHYTKLGNTIPTVIISFAIFIVLQKKDKLLFASAMVSTLFTNQIIKHIIQRPRPPLERRLVEQGGYSYPSGHTMMSLCLYGILIYLIITKVKDKKLKIIFTTLLTIMALLIGVSRIYVGVHYPSDVLGGYFCGLVVIILDVSIVNHYLKGE